MNRNICHFVDEPTALEVRDTNVRSSEAVLGNLSRLIYLISGRMRPDGPLILNCYLVHP